MTSIVVAVLRFCGQLVVWVIAPLDSLIFWAHKDEPPVENVRVKVGQLSTNGKWVFDGQRWVPTTSPAQGAADATPGLASGGDA